MKIYNSVSKPKKLAQNSVSYTVSNNVFLFFSHGFVTLANPTSIRKSMNLKSLSFFDLHFFGEQFISKHFQTLLYSTRALSDYHGSTYFKEKDA